MHIGLLIVTIDVLPLKIELYYHYEINTCNQVKHSLKKCVKSIQCPSGHSYSVIRIDLEHLVTAALPDRALSLTVSAPAAPLLHGWLPLQPHIFLGLFLPAAAQCAAASPSEPPAAPWCRKSSARIAQTSRSAKEKTKKR